MVVALLALLFLLVEIMKKDQEELHWMAVAVLVLFFLLVVLLQKEQDKLH